MVNLRLAQRTGLRVLATLVLLSALAMAGCNRQAAVFTPATGGPSSLNGLGPAYDEAARRMTDEEAGRASAIEDRLKGASSDPEQWTEHVSAVTVNADRVSLWLDERVSSGQPRSHSLKSITQEVLAELDMQDYTQVDAWFPKHATAAVSADLAHVIVAGDEWQLAQGIRMTVPTSWVSDSALTRVSSPLALHPGDKFRIYRYVDDYTAFDLVKVVALSANERTPARGSLAPSGIEATSLRRGGGEIVARSWVRAAGHSGGTYVTELLVSASGGDTVRITAVFVELPSHIEDSADSEGLATAVLDLLSVEVE